MLFRSLDATEQQRAARRSDVGVLVTKRRGKGAASVGAWWAHLPGWAYIYLSCCPVSADATSDEANEYRVDYDYAPPVRMTLLDAVLLLRAGGYGDPLTEETAA